MLLSETIPQFCYCEERPQHWSVFLHKTCKGSHKGPEILKLAVWALANRLRGWELVSEEPIEEFERIIGDALPIPSPFNSFQDFLDRLYQSGFLPGPMKALDQPFAQRQEYDALWARAMHVVGHRLTHDAAFYCFHHWTAEEFIRLDNAVQKDGAHYNSQDAVAAMLFWAIAWATTSATVREV